jgi:iron complex outermembrane receptor protein
MNKFRLGLLATASFVLTAAPAFAQTATSASADTSTPQDTSVSAESDHTDSDDIVVTAQKRSERLQNVPIAISVVSGEQLNKVTVQGIGDVLNRLPNITSSYPALGMPVVTIRGIGGSGAGATTALYIDGAPFTFALDARVPNIDFYDLDRIEVLRGPQGTLYGSNSLSGVVRVLTGVPDLTDYQFRVRGKVSATKDGGSGYRGDAVMNIPIIDGKLAARLSVSYDDIPGWIDRPARINRTTGAIDKPANDDANEFTVRNIRAKVRATPTDNLTIDASAWVQRTKYNAQNIGTRDRKNDAPDDDQGSNGFDAYSLIANLDIGAATITSSSGLIKFKAESHFSLGSLATPAFPAELRLNVSRYDDKMLSQELLVNSNSKGPWRWTLGASYRDVSARRIAFQSNQAPFVATSIPTDLDYTSKSIAVFGNLTRELLDGKFEISGGLRYFSAKVTMQENISSFSPARPLISDEGTFNALTPRAVLSWKPTSDFTAYMSYSQGFREGIAQRPAAYALAPTLTVTQPDKLVNYEVGAKGSLFNRMVTFDTAAFLFRWKDIQTTLNSLLSDGQFVAAVLNTGNVAGAGFEASTAIHPGGGFSFGGQVGYTQLRSLEDTISPGPNGGALAIRRKGQLINFPRWTTGAWAEYAFPVSAGLEGRLNGSVSHQSNFGQLKPSLASLGGDLPVKLFDAMTAARVSLELSRPGRWTATLFVDNLTDEKGTTYDTKVYESSATFPATGYDSWNARVQPRTIGLMFEFRY